MTTTNRLLTTLLTAVSLLAACSNIPNLLVDEEDDGGSGGHSNLGGEPNLIIDGSGGDKQTGSGGGNVIVAGPTCGDGVLDEGEECDDTNGKPGDGCTGICTIEFGYICDEPGEDCQLAAECGNSILETGEGCDFGGPGSVDGCGADCQVQDGWGCDTTHCVAVVTATCGDGLITPPETCEDGAPTPGYWPGCSDHCAVENGYSCLTIGEQCDLIDNEYCGNGILVTGEECDDANGNPGDGCTGSCELEQGYECLAPSEACTVKCGDGFVIGVEACDDHNQADDDGCSADCSQVEPGHVCPIAAGVGGPCQATAAGAVCPNAKIEYGEGCDDGNPAGGDGCTGCTVDEGYVCPSPGSLCELIPVCGDGFVDVKLGEQCDDSDLEPLDGCDDDCQVEPNFRCPNPTPSGKKLLGGNCTAIVCGDGAQQGSEQCDDFNDESSDGCSSTCQVESGWICPLNASCQASSCGDSVKAGIEDCDNGASNNGTTSVGGVICASNCTYVADPSLCGNGPSPGVRPLDPGESCDDGNLVPWDGCTTGCTKEPSCPKSGGACSSTCGDGMILPGDNEVCDDGNTRDGDGCDHLCQPELGYTCSTSAAALPDVWDVPVIYRDMNREATATGTHHLDFDTYGGSDRTAGMVGLTLDAVDGKPVYTGICEKNAQIGPCPWGNETTSKTAFDQWYRTTAGVNIAKVTTMPLSKQPNGSYAYLPASLFPLDNQGLVLAGEENAHSNGHNYGFTTELRGWFTYAPGQQLNFSGDDDVWVFVNGKLALDLGGLHPQRSGFVVLGDATGDKYACETVTLEDPNPDSVVKTCRDLGLVAGKVYEIALFHAERHATGSNFNLTLSGFLKNPSVCTTTCGDGIKANVEQCDKGDTCADHSTCAGGFCDNGLPCNDNSYGGCTKGPNKTTGCRLGPFCGDGVATSPEECDDGKNSTLYSVAENQAKCSSGCLAVPFCGDHEVAVGFEQCDGTADCKSDCTLKAQCGDGTQDSGEACDDGAFNGTIASACDTACGAKCGNKSIDAGEQCDPVLGFSSAYGGCLPPVGNQQGCLLGPHCGDGVPNGNEACDDGKNDGSYGTCASGCLLPPRCGDSIPQTTAGEICDKGPSNIVATYVASGGGQCTKSCKPVRYCGDKQVTDSEVCDDGKNDGSPGSCSANCSTYIELLQCGDGNMDAGEACDDGNATNGTVGSTCDTHCRIKCGNGVKDSGEACDDGANNGAYGTCKNNCSLANYCGDDTKNGPEECDNGDDNQTNPYGTGCTKACKNAPKCGDGRLDLSFGEECDGQAGCSACHWQQVH